jgi:hypothetical protein
MLMNRRSLLALWFLLIALLGPSRPARADDAPRARAERTVFVAGGLSDEQAIVLSSGLAGDRPGVLLLDAPRFRTYARTFLEAYRADRVIPVGRFAEDHAQLSRQLGSPLAPLAEWRQGPPEAFWRHWFPKADEVVVCPAAPRRLLLRAACLAGAARAPLYVLHGTEEEEADLRRRVTAWGTRRVFAVGSAGAACRGLPVGSVVPVADEQAVATAYLDRLTETGPVSTLVVANPTDAPESRPAMSSLAPWVAARRRAALLLTSPRGDAADLIRAALKKPALRQAEHLILVGDHRALPREVRPSPLPGRNERIELEPPGPPAGEPFTFATGRLFHREPGIVTLMLARQELLAAATAPRKALIVSNPHGGLPLLETISRHTAREFRNAGYETKTFFGHEANRDKIRKALPEQDIFLWEGHHGTLVAHYQAPSWREPLRPSFVFLQSCLALSDPVALPFLEHGAVSVVGSSALTFSGTGGAFAEAYFDALLYDQQSVGGALRQSKNFLLAYAKLKEQRLGKSAKMGGANIRSAWAFTLWGDPTLQLPRPERPKSALPVVRADVQGHLIVLTLPEAAYDKVVTDKYQAVALPNGRLAGLLTKPEEGAKKPLVPMLFAEVRLKAPKGKAPRLTSRVPSDHWVFLWDGRRQAGYLLVRPRRRDREEIRFRVTWED